MNTQSQKISEESRRKFAQKVARSIVEVQPNINNTADIVVLLECLGYRIETVMQNGFEDFYALASYVYDFIDAYEMREKSKDLFAKSFTMEVPKISKRIAEGVGLIFPWLGSLALLFLTGVSLWMATGFPTQTTTAFVTGVFFGVIVTEGTLQVFNRLFLYYHEQNNIGEVKRLLKRSYRLVGIVLLITIGILCLIGYAEKISFHLISLTIISMVTISIHRASYMVIYALKKIFTLIVAYSSAFGILLSTYYFGQFLIPAGITRYFMGLVFAFTVLSIFSVYQHWKLTKNIAETLHGEKPHFYNPISRTDKTIKSKFSIQLWETIPYSIYSTFYLITMFSDRILSWIYNPIVLKGNFGLPMAFNSIYHVGADMAWMVLLPASIIQYVLIAPIYINMNNISITIKVSESNSVNAYIRATYRKMVLVSMMASIVTACVLNLVAPPMMTHAGVSQTSIQIFQIASVANVFMCLFTTNGLFMMWLNKTKILAIIVIISSTIVITYGILSNHHELQNLTLGYLIGSAFAAITSLIYINKIIRRAASIIFSKLL